MAACQVLPRVLPSSVGEEELGVLLGGSAASLRGSCWEGGRRSSITVDFLLTKCGCEHIDCHSFFEVKESNGDAYGGVATASAVAAAGTSGETPLPLPYSRKKSAAQQPAEGEEGLGGVWESAHGKRFNYWNGEIQLGARSRPPPLASCGPPSRRAPGPSSQRRWLRLCTMDRVADVPRRQLGWLCLVPPPVLAGPELGIDPAGAFSFFGCKQRG